MADSMKELMHILVLILDKPYPSSEISLKIFSGQRGEEAHNTGFGLM